MNSNGQFDNKYVCLVPTCNRPNYNMRRQSNQATFNILKSYNFVIVYLYSDNSISSLNITNVGHNEYNMVVPAPEIYELISYKMDLAYKFFSKIDVKGILKIDDNTVISYPDIIEQDFLDLVEKYDYIGVEQHTVEKGYIKLNNKTDMPLLGNIYHNLDIDFTYFVGPFYYLSANALKTVAEPGLTLGNEDIAVGYEVSKNAMLKQYLWNFKNKGVSWSN